MPQHAVRKYVSAKPKGHKKLRIFISHKSKDKGAVRVIKAAFEHRCRNMAVFASCDAESLLHGDRWSEVVHKELNRADWLVLLYTAAGENWEWCIYEAGYFAGRRTCEKTRTLTVIHPPGVMIPPPLRAWQSVEAVPEALFNFLKLIVKPGLPRCHWTGTRKDLEQLAGAISEAVRPLAGRSHEPNQSMTIVVPPTDQPLAPDDLPDQAHVVLDRPMADLLDLQEDEQYPWPQFREKARGFCFDIRSLVKAVHDARSQQAVPTSLEQFRAPRDRQGYRPIIYSVSWKKSGEVQLKLVFWAQSKADPALSNSFERVRRLFNIASRFRHRVDEQYGNEALKFRPRPLAEKIGFLNWRYATLKMC